MTEHRQHERSTTVSGWPVAQYGRIVKWPALATVVMNIIVTTAKWNIALVWFFTIALMIFLGTSVARVYRGTLGNAAGLGLAAGLIVGVFTSLFQFVWFHNVAAFFEIIRTSLLSMLVGVLMSSSAYLVLAKDHREKSAKHH